MQQNLYEKTNYDYYARKRNMIKQRRRIRRVQLIIIFGVLLSIIGFSTYKIYSLFSDDITTEADTHRITKSNNLDLSKYPQEIIELYEKNSETLDFVKNYNNREEYLSKKIDLSGDYKDGEVPLLMQWDKRWGYDSYGDSIIAAAGCGPTCLSMAYIYLTGDTTMNPREMASYADENGYYTKSGTSWSLWTSGISDLNLSSSEVPLDENVIKKRLDNGNVIICSMGPGDFTTIGHFILIYGYDKNGFYVNDPNRVSNSQKQWNYDTLRNQIKNMWSINK